MKELWLAILEAMKPGRDSRNRAERRRDKATKGKKRTDGEWRGGKPTQKGHIERKAQREYMRGKA